MDFRITLVLFIEIYLSIWFFGIALWVINGLQRWSIKDRPAKINQSMSTDE